MVNKIESKIEKLEDFSNNYCKNTSEILEKMKSLGFKEYDDTTKTYKYLYVEPESSLIVGRSSAPTEREIQIFELGFEFELEDITI